MDSLFSLEYYDRIFGRRGPQFWALVSALEEELESYAEELPTVVTSRDRTALARLRHAHRPVLVNLRLDHLRALETQVMAALDANLPTATLQILARRFGDEIRGVKQTLAESRRMTSTQ